MRRSRTVTPSNGTGLDPVATLSALSLTGIGNQIGGDGNLTIKPVITGTPGSTFTKIGSGTLTLTAANTYDGITTVAAGKLAVTGSILNVPSVTVDAPGTLELANATGSVLTATTPVANDGLLRVTAGNQEVDSVSGLGSTNVVSGSLTADSIVQNTLTIGAGGSVTIRETPSAAGQANVSQVPEPGTWVLIGTAVLGWLGLRRRRPSASRK